MILFPQRKVGNRDLKKQKKSFGWLIPSFQINALCLKERLQRQRDKNERKSLLCKEDQKVLPTLKKYGTYFRPKFLIGMPKKHFAQ